MSPDANEAITISVRESRGGARHSIWQTIIPNYNYTSGGQKEERDHTEISLWMESAQTESKDDPVAHTQLYSAAKAGGVRDDVM